MIVQRSQYGLTLVEVMVGVTLSLILLIGMTTIFLGNRETYTVQTSLQRYQEDVRMANFALGRAIRNAGAYGIVLTVNGSAQYVDGDGTVLTDKQGLEVAKEMIISEDLMFGGAKIIESPSTNDGTAGSLPHSLTVRYKSRGSMYDCLGGLVGTVSTASACIVANTFAIDTGNNQFTCSVTNSCGANTAAQPLIDNVEDMAIRYGIDTDADGSADQYVWPSEVSDWETVVSVQVALLATSGADVKPVAAATTYFAGIGIAGGAGVTSPTDRLARREYELIFPVNRRLHNDD